MADQNRGWTILEFKGDDNGPNVVARVKQYEEGYSQNGYPDRISLIWVYGSSETGMPSSEEMEQFELFENSICDAVEDDSHSTLSIITTGAGERAWVFYSTSVDGFMERLSNCPHPNGPYPIEVEYESDPAWELYAQFNGGAVF